MQFLTYISSQIIMGLKFLIPLLFILRIERLKPRLTNGNSLVIAFNVTLLLAALVFVFGYIANFFLTYYSGVEYMQYAIVNRATGMYWFGFWLPASINVLLPQLIWFKKVRNSVRITYIWFGLSLALSIFIKAIFITVWTKRDYIPSNTGSVWMYYNVLPTLYSFALSIAVTLVVLTAVYFMVFKKKTNSSFL